mmetsp:Transcript_18744/g.47135  ORF Transcript_18744/g.47135 Transcript_18744/m.47135 type:complete len:86 (+) Transcript_18744:597-854(+)
MESTEVPGSAVHPIQQYDVIVSSFAMHLMNRSQLFSTSYALAGLGSFLVIISPHKQPTMDAQIWRFLDEVVHERVHFKLYRSQLI